MAEIFGKIIDEYKTIATDVSATFVQYITESDGNYSYPWDFVRDIRQYTQVSIQDVVVPCVLALFLTALRMGLTAYIFLPMAKWMRMTSINESKFPESAWKTLYYSGTWSYTVYLLFFTGKYEYFSKPGEIWKDWEAGMDIPLDICVLYMLEMGFYLHSLYGTIYMDHWRKDSNVMLFHHIVSVVLLTFSYATRYYKIGVLVLFVHDVADILLEFTKCNVYMKNRGGKHHALNEHISTLGFLCFTAVWYVFRLYWFPIKVIYSAGHTSLMEGPEHVLPFYLIFNCLLWVILLLDTYWWMYIVAFLFRVATGQIKEVDDIREEDVVTHMSTPLKCDGTGDNGEIVMNGVKDASHVNGKSSSSAVKNGSAKVYKIKKEQ